MTGNEIKTLKTGIEILYKEMRAQHAIWFGLVFLLCLFVQNTSATEITELIQEQEVTVIQQQSIPNGLSVESGILMNNGVPVIAGGMSVREIHNPWMMNNGSDEEYIVWENRVKKFFNDLEANRNNFIRLTTIIYWKEMENPALDQVPATEYLFQKYDGQHRFKLDVRENYNENWLSRLKTIIGMANDRGIIVQLDMFDNCILRSSGTSDAAIRWDESPFVNCDEAGLIWPEGIPNNGLEEFYTNHILREYLEPYVEKIVNETEEYPNVIYSVMNEPEQEALDSGFEQAVIQWIKAYDSCNHLIATNWFGSDQLPVLPEPSLISIHGRDFERGRFDAILAAEHQGIVSTDTWNPEGRINPDVIKKLAQTAFSRYLVLDNESDDFRNRPDEDIIPMAAVLGNLDAEYLLLKPDNLNLPSVDIFLNKQTGGNFHYEIGKRSVTYSPNEEIVINIRYASPEGYVNEDYKLYIAVLLGNDLYDLYIRNLNFFMENWETPGHPLEFDIANPFSGNCTITIPQNSNLPSGVYSFYAAFLDLDSSQVVMPDPRDGKEAFGNWGEAIFSVTDGGVYNPSGGIKQFFNALGIKPPGIQQQLDKPRYEVEDVVSIEVVDPERIGEGVIEVNLTSKENPEGVTVDLIEDEPGVFTGDVEISNDADPGKLEVGTEDELKIKNVE